MKIKFIKIFSILTVMLLLATILTGCTPEGKDLMMGFVQEWVNTKFGVDMTDTSFSGRLIAGAKLVKLFNEDSTGNADADAALGTAKMLKIFGQAENLMAQGKKNSDPALMDQAIKLRPGDWSYRVSRTVLALKQNDVDTAGTQFKTGEDRSYYDHNENGTVQFYTQYIDEVEAWKNTGALDKAPLETQLHTYGMLSTSYSRRYAVTQDPKDKQMGDYYDAEWEHLNFQSGLPAKTTTTAK